MRVLRWHLSYILKLKMEVHNHQHHSEPKPVVSLKSPFTVLDCKKSFEGLSKNERLYAYYLSRASWVGEPICFFQRSYESPILLYLLLKAFKAEVTRTLNPESQTPNLASHLLEQTNKIDRGQAARVFLRLPEQLRELQILRRLEIHPGHRPQIPLHLHLLIPLLEVTPGRLLRPLQKHRNTAVQVRR